MFAWFKRLFTRKCKKPEPIKPAAHEPPPWEREELWSRTSRVAHLPPSYPRPSRTRTVAATSAAPAVTMGYAAGGGGLDPTSMLLGGFIGHAMGSSSIHHDTSCVKSDDSPSRFTSGGGGDYGGGGASASWESSSSSSDSSSSSSCSSSDSSSSSSDSSSSCSSSD